jgi:hypothetical protein
MPKYSADAADMNVAKVAYAQATKLGASAKIKLALFEAGLVESNFQNLKKAVDHDSLGYLQQRPSQGWKNPTNIITATTSFVNRAKSLESKHSSAASLAQAVQVSAYPERYGQASSAAAALLKRVDSSGDWMDALKRYGSGVVDGIVGAVPGASTASDIVGAINNVGSGIKSIGTTVASGAKVSEQLLKLALPTNMMRAAIGGLGIVFLFIGIYSLTRAALK